MVKTIHLPAELRPLLRKTFGVLYTGTGDDTIQKLSKDLGSPTKLISVGDVTTFHLLNSNIIPDILIVDDRTKRGPASACVVVGTKHTGFSEIFVDNPPGVTMCEYSCAAKRTLQHCPQYCLHLKVRLCCTGSRMKGWCLSISHDLKRKRSLTCWTR